MYTRKFISIGLAIVVAVMLLTPVVGGGIAADIKEGNIPSELVLLAKSYLTAQYEVLVSGEKAALEKAESSLRGEARRLLTETAETQLSRRNFLREFGGAYTSYEVELKVESVKLQGDQATVFAEEHSTLRFETKTSAEPVLTQSRTKHEFRFLNEGGKWFLAEDIRLDEPKPVKPEGDDLPIKAAPLKPPLHPEELKQVGEQRLRVREKSSSPSPKSWVYWDRYAARDYARYYALWPNWSFRYFPDDDCTNFISQAVLAGGWPMRWGYYRSIARWWYNQDNQTWTWINAERFWRFTRHDDRAYVGWSWYWLWIGDVIQIDFDNDGVIDHSMMVTWDDGAWGGADIYVSYHTNNRLDVPIYEVWWRWPYSSYYLWYMESFED